jgi:hypothetical protein
MEVRGKELHKEASSTAANHGFTPVPPSQQQPPDSATHPRMSVRQHVNVASLQDEAAQDLLTHLDRKFSAEGNVRHAHKPAPLRHSYAPRRPQSSRQKSDITREKAPQAAEGSTRSEPASPATVLEHNAAAREVPYATQTNNNAENLGTLRLKTDMDVGNIAGGALVNNNRRRPYSAGGARVFMHQRAAEDGVLYVCNYMHIHVHHRAGEDGM